jgi:hypothetical protein
VIGQPQPVHDVLGVCPILRRDSGDDLGACGLIEIGELESLVLGDLVELQRPERGVHTAEDRHLAAVSTDEVLRLRPPVETGQGAEDDGDRQQGQQQAPPASPPAAPLGLGRGNAGTQVRPRDVRGPLSGAVGAGDVRSRRVHERAGDDRDVVDQVPDARADRVGDDHGHVVRPAAAQGQFDEPVGALLRIEDPHRLRDRLRRDDVRQAVGAEQVPVTGASFPNRDVGLDLGATKRPQNHRLARVVLRLVRGELAGVDEVLHVGVVVRDLREHVAT